MKAAWAASMTKDTYLSSHHYRLLVRRGKKKAAVAVVHSILVIVHHLLRDDITYQELGADYLTKLKASQIQYHHEKRLQALGFKVTLEQIEQAA
jgi:hypothetical protein